MVWHAARYLAADGRRRRCSRAAPAALRFWLFRALLEPLDVFAELTYSSFYSVRYCVLEFPPALSWVWAIGCRRRHQPPAARLKNGNAFLKNRETRYYHQALPLGLRSLNRESPLPQAARVCTRVTLEIPQTRVVLCVIAIPPSEAGAQEFMVEQATVR